MTWPGITELNFSKLIGTTIPIEKGHMDQERKKMRSTKEEEKLDFFPIHNKDKQYELFAKVEKNDFSSTDPKLKAYSDQTGRFPHKSSRGNQYLFTLYDYVGNVTLGEPLKSRGGKIIAAAFTKCYARLTRHGNNVK